MSIANYVRAALKLENAPLKWIKSSAQLLTLEETAEIYDSILPNDQVMKAFLIDKILDHLIVQDDVDPLHDFINEVIWSLDDERLLSWSMENRDGIYDYTRDRFAREIANNAPGAV